MDSAQNIPIKTPRIGFLEAVARCLKKYATFKGRATRAEYWWFALFNSLLCTVVYAVFYDRMGMETAESMLGFVQLALFLPALAVGVRRLHDINFRGWWIVLTITIIGIIPLCIFYCLAGKPEENRFGIREV